ncbi:hypothetical protein ABXJ75_003530 [Yersinia enterocolitica]|uniref:hypothetical protein n=1 Tax=Yersinia TaxID=629 RepID=UPI000C1E8FB2|nr:MULTISPECIES: hypothetical protein [Yersinia]EKN3469496.1 hypothetical protein [Yersinia enterocolitica]EKN3875523.1 hypothetical protein [Yersinia enterocolitica]EKN4173301.1 hypothetical protein [Yersinia enterocolitica]EKN6086943.1 hypothetical protein [Yersinia enterocolitica]ELY5228625.1 hypothetical protein [Yersinia enterocolitica]
MDNSQPIKQVENFIPFLNELITIIATPAENTQPQSQAIAFADLLVDISVMLHCHLSGGPVISALQIDALKADARKIIR